jgi:hypothetical protein
MSVLTMPLLWAQIAGETGSPTGASATGIGNPAALASLAFRRWCSGVTLSSPLVAPSLDGLWAFLAGLAVLLCLALVLQGPLPALKQLVDISGHVALVRRATQRVWRAGRLIAAAITVTVLSWTGSQTLGFVTDKSDKGKAELTLLSRSRTRLELGLEQGILAGLTPLRDVAALGDNLPLLICAVYLVFRASSGTLPPPGPVPGRVAAASPLARSRSRYQALSGWATLVWGLGATYILYRLVARASGSVDLPLGGCLVAEALVVPLIMVVCDGFLLAWMLTELRRAGFGDLGEDRSHPGHALELMPAAALACALALPARYVGTLVFLALQHLPTSVGSTSVGRYIRWQLGWGLIDLQAVAIVVLGIVGVVAWSRGSLRDAVGGFKRLLQKQAGHLIAAFAMSGVAACLLAGIVYPIVLLLPPAGWVLPAADSYAHYATLPVGLWTLAALIELAEHSLPAARLVEVTAGGIGDASGRAEDYANPRAGETLDGTRSTEPRTTGRGDADPTAISSVGPAGEGTLARDSLGSFRENAPTPAEPAD